MTELHLIKSTPSPAFAPHDDLLEVYTDREIDSGPGKTLRDAFIRACQNDARELYRALRVHVPSATYDELRKLMRANKMADEVPVDPRRWDTDPSKSYPARED